MGFAMYGSDRSTPESGRTRIRSAAGYWQQQGWITADPSRMLRRRNPRPDRSRALDRAAVEQLLTREDVSLPERVLWRMAYETAARSAELLGLNVEDLDLPNRPRQGPPQGPGSAAAQPSRYTDPAEVAASDGVS